MIDFNRPIQTRDGRKVEILATDVDENYPVWGFVTETNGDRSARGWTAEGKRYVHVHEPFLDDLVNAPQEVKIEVSE